ncbi:MAG: molybdate ABC transporter substrate-binding protein [Deltaproteobacteria bacterium]|nr:molybdate ABC transporter substrate-binding protein [Deltaproteobacteria bacterium]
MIVKKTVQILCLLAAVFMLLFTFHESSFAADRKLTVAGAADLSLAFKEIAAEFEKETGYKVVLSLGSTGMLAKQIEQGAPFDAFFGANRKFVEDLEKGGHILPGTVELYAQGRIVIAVNSGFGLKITSLDGLRDGRIAKIAIANPEHAPYGMAAMEALKSAGLWEELKPRLVYGENIRQTLQFVQAGNAQAGIVALSIANIPGIEYSEVPLNRHRPIIQAAGVVSSSKEKEGARAFIKFVNGPKGALIMKKYGFLPPGAR